jgi:hypothetical protein
MPGSEQTPTPRKLQWGEAKPGGLFGLLYDTWLDTYIWLGLFTGGALFGFGLYAVINETAEGQWVIWIGGGLLLLSVVLFVVRARKPPGWGGQP